MRRFVLHPHLKHFPMRFTQRQPSLPPNRPIWCDPAGVWAGEKAGSICPGT